MKQHGALNRVFCVVFSRSLQSWVVVSEYGKTRTKGRFGGSRALRRCLYTVGTLLSVFAGAAPVNGRITQGVGSITQQGSRTQIVQSSPLLGINWQNFNLNAGESVDFQQPSASSVAVNQIGGSLGSQILGRIKANGQIYLINPNGIVFGAGSVVDVGGLVASTLQPNLLAWPQSQITWSGSSTGSVVNKGQLQGTYVALLGTNVLNQGSIKAVTGGTVALGAGTGVRLTFADNQLVHLEVAQNTLKVLVDNGGIIAADGGRVYLNAGARNSVLSSVVNNTGVIEARTVHQHQGVIDLLGGMNAGQTLVDGTLDVSAPQGGHAGQIETSAHQVTVADSALIKMQAKQSANAGSWLLDPADFTVAATGGNMTGSALTTALASGDVTILSSQGTTASGSGDININDAVQWMNHNLTLTAAHSVNVGAVMTASGSAALTINTAIANGGDSAVNTGSLNMQFNAQSSGFLGRIDDRSTGALKINGGTYTLVNTQQGLQKLSASGLYALGADLSGTGSFTPLATSNTPFSGTFQGLGHSIAGLTINTSPTATQDVGLFADVTGLIDNVGLSGGSVTGNGGSTGALVGMLNGGSIQHCFSSTTTVTGTNNVGGLVGLATDRSISGSTSTLPSSISDSFSTAVVQGTDNVGGLVGLAMDSQTPLSISNSYFAGSGVSGTNSVSGTHNVGGLVGMFNDLQLNNSFYDIGTVSINGATAVLTAGGLYDTQYQDWFSHALSLNISKYSDLVADSAQSGLYDVSTVQGLQDMLGFSEQINASAFKLTANVNLSTVPGFYIPYWSGSFDGGSNTLYNISLSSNNNIMGLFGILTTTASLQNLNVNSENITANGTWTGAVGSSLVTALSNSLNQGGVGALVGRSMEATISNVQVSNATITTTTTTDVPTGGVVGVNTGTITGANADSSVQVKATSDQGQSSSAAYLFGGLVGANLGSISLSGSDSSVTVTSAQNSPSTDRYYTLTGGLTAYNSGTISSSIASLGNVTVTVGDSQDEITGGFAGLNTGIINLSQSSGMIVSGAGLVGGLVGQNGLVYGVSSATTPLINNSAVQSNSVTALLYSGAGGTWAAGGLVGLNLAVVDNSSVGSASTASSVWVNGTGYNLGGLVGENEGIVNNSISSISVADSSGATTIGVGGLIGLNNNGTCSSCTVNEVYATGAVTAATGSDVGGLIGNNVSGSVNNAYSTGLVSLTGSGSGGSGGNAGALYGVNTGTVGTATYSSSTIDVNGTYSVPSQSFSHGALTGLPSGFSGSYWVVANKSLIMAPTVYVNVLGGSSVYGSNPVLSPVELDNLGLPVAPYFFTGTAVFSNGPTASTPVGSISSIPIDLSGLKVTPLSPIPWQLAVGTSLTWAVTPAPLSIQVTTNTTKVYGQPFSLSGAVTDCCSITGLQNTDAIASMTLSSLGTASTAVVGSYAVQAATPVAASGNAFNPNNYAITVLPGSLKVTPAPLTVTGLDVYKGLGMADPQLTVHTAGLVAGDIQSAVVQGALSRSSGEGVGVYTETQGSLTVSPNYTLNWVPGSVRIVPLVLSETERGAVKTPMTVAYSVPVGWNSAVGSNLMVFNEPSPVSVDQGSDQLPLVDAAAADVNIEENALKDAQHDE